MLLTEVAFRGDSSAWAACGFSLGPEGEIAVGRVRLRVSDEAAPGLGFESLDESIAEIDGLRVYRADSPLPGEHPNGALGIDHVAVLTPHIGRTLLAFESAGCDLRRVRAAGRDPALGQGFFRVGEAVIEVAGPVDTIRRELVDQRPPRLAPRDGDGAPGVAEEPARVYGLVVTVADIERSVADLGDRVGRIKDAVQQGRQIATMRAEAGLGPPVALMSPER